VLYKNLVSVSDTQVSVLTVCKCWHVHVHTDIELVITGLAGRAPNVTVSTLGRMPASSRFGWMMNSKRMLAL